MDTTIENLGRPMKRERTSVKKDTSSTKFTKTLMSMVTGNTNLKKALSHANQENIIIPYLHGLQIKHRKFASYVFILDTPDNRKLLQTREFEINDEFANYDDIFKLGAIAHNKQFNLLIELIDDTKWKALMASIDIAENSVKSFVDQCKVLHTAFNSISNM